MREKTEILLRFIQRKIFNFMDEMKTFCQLVSSIWRIKCQVQGLIEYAPLAMKVHICFKYDVSPIEHGVLLMFAIIFKFKFILFE